jgi:hypothetical protein
LVFCRTIVAQNIYYHILSFVISALSSLIIGQPHFLFTIPSNAFLFQEHWVRKITPMKFLLSAFVLPALATLAGAEELPAERNLDVVAGKKDGVGYCSISRVI